MGAPRANRRSLALGLTAALGVDAALGPIPLTGKIGETVLQGGGYGVGADLFGPFQGGIDKKNLTKLTNLGCSPRNDVLVPPGVDVFFAEEEVEAQCGIKLGVKDGQGRYKGLYDECGGSNGVLQSDLSCLYAKAPEGHSPKVATVGDGQFLYGKWEELAKSKETYILPALDACNGHFGVTPESNGAEVYHYHVTDLPPHLVGCYGPAKNEKNEEVLVSPTVCRTLYTGEKGCGGDIVSIADAKGGVQQYDPYCPCFEGLSNVEGGMDSMPPAAPAPAKVFKTEVKAVLSGTVEDFAAQSTKDAVLRVLAKAAGFDTTPAGSTIEFSSASVIAKATFPMESKEEVKQARKAFIENAGSAEELTKFIEKEGGSALASVKAERDPKVKSEGYEAEAPVEDLDDVSYNRTIRFASGRHFWVSNALVPETESFADNNAWGLGELAVDKDQIKSPDTNEHATFYTWTKDDKEQSAWFGKLRDAKWDPNRMYKIKISGKDNKKDWVRREAKLPPSRTSTKVKIKAKAYSRFGWPFLFKVPVAKAIEKHLRDFETNDFAEPANKDTISSKGAFATYYSRRGVFKGGWIVSGGLEELEFEFGEGYVYFSNDKKDKYMMFDQMRQVVEDVQIERAFKNTVSGPKRRMLDSSSAGGADAAGDGDVHDMNANAPSMSARIPHTLRVDPGDFEFSMMVESFVEVDGAALSDGHLVAHIGGERCGVGAASAHASPFGPYQGHRYYSFSLFGEGAHEGEAVTFSFHHADGRVLPLTTPSTFTFNADRHVGSLDAPLVLSHTTSTTATTPPPSLSPSTTSSSPPSPSPQSSPPSPVAASPSASSPAPSTDDMVPADKPAGKTPSEEEEAPLSSPLSEGAIVGIAVGVSVGVLAIALALAGRAIFMKRASKAQPVLTTTNVVHVSHSAADEKVAEPATPSNKV